MSEYTCLVCGGPHSAWDCQMADRKRDEQQTPTPEASEAQAPALDRLDPKAVLPDAGRVLPAQEPLSPALIAHAREVAEQIARDESMHGNSCLSAKGWPCDCGLEAHMAGWVQNYHRIIASALLAERREAELDVAKAVPAIGIRSEAPFSKAVARAFAGVQAAKEAAEAKLAPLEATVVNDAAIIAREMRRAEQAEQEIAVCREEFAKRGWGADDSPLADGVRDASEALDEIEAQLAEAEAQLAAARRVQREFWYEAARYIRSLDHLAVDVPTLHWIADMLDGKAALEAAAEDA